MKYSRLLFFLSFKDLSTVRFKNYIVLRFKLIHRFSTCVPCTTDGSQSKMCSIACVNLRERIKISPAFKKKPLTAMI